jgi:hypothetical protein
VTNAERRYVANSWVTSKGSGTSTLPPQHFHVTGSATEEPARTMPGLLLTGQRRRHLGAVAAWQGAGMPITEFLIRLAGEGHDERSGVQ